MKKLVLFAAVVFAVSFAACSSKTADAKKGADSTATTPAQSEFAQSAQETAVADGENVVTIDGEENASEKTPAIVNETVVK